MAIQREYHVAYGTLRLYAESCFRTVVLSM